MSVAVAILAYQEERRIATCLASLPLDRPDTRFHVVVNGSTDRTVAIAREWAARHPSLTVHDLPQPGKANAWNHYMARIEAGDAQHYIFVDGDAEIAPGSIDALVQALDGSAAANAAAGMPLNGRRHRTYQQRLREDGGLFGDLYALSGGFVAAMRARNIALPADLIGDDGLLAAFAMTGLGSDADWDRRRIIPCDGAGFRSETIRLIDPRTWRIQYRRMINYSVRYFQNRIISDIMQREGPEGLPPRLANLYPQWLPRFVVRRGITGWFDRIALKRMRSVL